MRHNVRARMVAHPTTSLHLLDAELCARLCRHSGRFPIDWPTVTIRRIPRAFRDESGEYDVITISGWAGATRT